MAKKMKKGPVRKAAKKKKASKGASSTGSLMNSVMKRGY